MQTQIGVVDSPAVRTADERWAAWLAKGVEHDRKTRRRAIAAAAVFAGGTALWLTIVTLLG